MRPVTGCLWQFYMPNCPELALTWPMSRSLLLRSCSTLAPPCVCCSRAEKFQQAGDLLLRDLPMVAPQLKYLVMHNVSGTISTCVQQACVGPANCFGLGAPG